MNLTLDQICEVIVKLQKQRIPVPTKIVNEYWRLIKKEK